MTTTDIWFIKLTNFTTRLKCHTCGVRAEVVVENEFNHAVVIIEHLPTCEYSYLNKDISKYTKYPISETDLIKIKSFFNNGKTINGNSLEECLLRNGL